MRAVRRRVSEVCGMVQQIVFDLLSDDLGQYKPTNTGGTQGKHGLSRPHGATIPPVRTLESRNNRSGRGTFTPVFCESGALVVGKLRIMACNDPLPGF